MADGGGGVIRVGYEYLTSWLHLIFISQRFFACTGYAGGAIGRAADNPSPVRNVCETGGKVKAPIIDIDNQIVGEEAAIVGTPFRLMYFSDHVVEGVHNYRIQMPVPFGLWDTKTDVEVTVAGRVMPPQIFPPLPDQVYEVS
jgi:hypothetical protein